MTLLRSLSNCTQILSFQSVNNEYIHEKKMYDSYFDFDSQQMWKKNNNKRIEFQFID